MRENLRYTTETIPGKERRYTTDRQELCNIIRGKGKDIPVTGHGGP
jgi:hypothetical protein